VHNTSLSLILLTSSCVQRGGMHREVLAAACPFDQVQEQYVPCDFSLSMTSADHLHFSFSTGLRIFMTSTTRELCTFRLLTLFSLPLSGSDAAKQYTFTYCPRCTCYTIRLRRGKLASVCSNATSLWWSMVDPSMRSSCLLYSFLFGPAHTLVLSSAAVTQASVVDSHLAAR
jgi:hypothetical protein